MGFSLKKELERARDNIRRETDRVEDEFQRVGERIEAEVERIPGNLEQEATKLRDVTIDAIEQVKQFFSPIIGALPGVDILKFIGIGVAAIIVVPLVLRAMR